MQIARAIKSKGTRIKIIATSSNAARSTLLAFAEKNIAGEGYGFLLSQSSSWYHVDSDEDQDILLNGVLYVAEPGTEAAETLAQYHGLKFATLLTDIGYAFIQAGISSNSATVLSTHTVRNELQGRYSVG